MYKGNVFLVGPMGAGKSSIGRQLAKRLKRRFLDSDKELEARTGVDIPTIFEFEGEEGFRHRESAILDELTQLQGIVLATGGGAVLTPANRKWLRTRGSTIYMCASVETQLARTSHDRNRPLLRTGDPRRTLTELIAVRAPLYLDVSELTVHTERDSVQSIVAKISRWVHRNERTLNNHTDRQSS